jgi:hypothetical protein
MAIYVCLAFLALGLMTLVGGNYSDRERKGLHFGVALIFVALAGIVVILSAVRSLWFYPLS